MLFSRENLVNLIQDFYVKIHIQINVENPDEVKRVLGEYSNLLPTLHSMKASTEYYVSTWTNKKRTLEEDDREIMRQDKLAHDLTCGFIESINSNSMALMAILKNSKQEKILNANQ